MAVLDLLMSSHFESTYADKQRIKFIQFIASNVARGITMETTTTFNTTKVSDLCAQTTTQSSKSTIADGVSFDVQSCTRACLAVVGSAELLQHLVRTRRCSGWQDWMKCMRPVPLAQPMQTSANRWRKEDRELDMYFQNEREHERLRVGNAGEAIRLRLLNYIGQDVVFDCDPHVLVGIEAPPATLRQQIQTPTTQEEDDEHENENNPEYQEYKDDEEFYSYSPYKNVDVVVPQGSIDVSVDNASNVPVRHAAVREWIEETGISLAAFGIHSPLPLSPFDDSFLCFNPEQMQLKQDELSGKLISLGSVHQNMALYIVDLTKHVNNLMPSLISSYGCPLPREQLPLHTLIRCFQTSHISARFKMQQQVLEEEESQSCTITYDREELDWIEQLYDKAYESEIASKMILTTSPTPQLSLKTEKKKSKKKKKKGTKKNDKQKKDSNKEVSHQSKQRTALVHNPFAILCD